MKKVFLFFEKIYWSIKCIFQFYLHGPYGLSRTIEKMPFNLNLEYLRKYGATIGNNCIIDSGFKIHRPDKKSPFKNLIIGNNVYIGHNFLMDLTDKIIFEDNTSLSANCQIWTHVGDYINNLRDPKDYKEKIAPVKIKSGTVCYANVILSPGVIIGKRARVYALSLVTENVPDECIFCGIPAKYLKNRNITD